MTLIGWYAKQRLKYLIAFLLISILFWYVFVREWKSYDTPFCYKEKCKIETAYGKDSRGGNCFGRKCIAGNCVGEGCRGGDCTGFNCKAGDCYGLNCTPGRCTDPTCKSKKDNNKTSPTFGQEIGCTQGKCADGRAYEIKRGKLRKYLKHLPENTTYNNQYCDDILAADQMKKSGTKESKIWESNMKISKIKFYHKGWQGVNYKKPKREGADPIIIQRDPIVDTIPSIYKGDNCQWCTQNNNNETCSDFKPKHEIEMTGADKDIIKDKWTWIEGTEQGCFPRDSNGIVINCKLHPTKDDRVTFQHEMVQISNNQYKCKICNRTCSV
jgi:hypothetical protein